MNRIIGYLNLAGILAMALLCTRQWVTNSRLAASLTAAQIEMENQRAKIMTQENTLRENAADLNDLHQRLSLSESELIQTQLTLRKAAAERDLLQQRSDQLLAAVNQRDDVLKKQTEVLTVQANSIHQLQRDRDQTIVKFNDLATKYNAIIGAQK